MRNLNTEISRIRGATRAGLLFAATIAKIESMRRVPVDTGALRASHYVTPEPQGRNTTVEIGVMQYYGIYVHEDLNMNHPNGGEAKFLERAIVAKKNEMVEAIRRTARVRR
jgi:hypothetical protein